VATTSVIGDLVAQVAGDAAEVHVLVPAGSDAHTFEPTPEDAAELADADVLFENGLGFEAWLTDLYQSSGTDAARVVVTANVVPLTINGELAEGTVHELHLDDPTAGTEQHEEETDDGDHQHGDYDPHVWHDVRNAMLMVETIRDTLVQQDPAHADQYAAHADQYLTELQALDERIVQQVSGIPEEHRKLVTAHNTFSYFAYRYGFEIVGTALGSVTTEVSDPSAQQIAELVDQIVASGVPAIFPETVSDPALLEQIASEAGVKVADPLYTDALGEPGSPGETYIGMMDYNATTIAAALTA
jgi:ABC-type Zn uptake system ZnuABC Zn-binding protein ZnuA